MAAAVQVNLLAKGTSPFDAVASPRVHDQVRTRPRVRSRVRVPGPQACASVPLTGVGRPAQLLPNTLYYSLEPSAAGALPSARAAVSTRVPLPSARATVGTRVPLLSAPRRACRDPADCKSALRLRRAAPRRAARSVV